MKDAGAVGRMIREYVEYRRAWRPGEKDDGTRWSQAHLARMIGISQKHMCQLVTGLKPLSIALALRLDAATDGDLSAKAMLHADLDEQIEKHRNRAPAPGARGQAEETEGRNDA